MILKMLSKTALFGGVGGAVYLTNSLDISDTLPPKQLDLQDSSFTKTINNLDDIKLYEKLNNCNFVFIDNWTNQTMYNFEKFLSRYETAEWKQRIIKGANTFKLNCKEKKIATLAFNNHKKVFELKI
ncbi:hypothetical protein A6V39_04115 [Candidatus Mycoplasma haematobovis]|uniref:Uncharacterized protein n=1 Tax=Candidatus Mycoplasma haematobovis TaxID=432608 RepID=A0A1A9QDA8_9MOLU|nr:hypothetical protein [Candidatus Mycoplasma haematobovis]OAL10074.1 hypothetical protein A6V39_04115 [Candidatus Mycoplasma haematobovis]